jgi:prolyl oligopeptidase
MRRTLLVSALLFALPAAAQPGPPATPVRPVVDTLHGVPVVDPYRWLEDRTSGEADAWFRVQAAYARATLAALPGRDALLARIRAIGAAAPPEVTLPWEAGGRWFYTVRRPGEAVPRGYVRDVPGGEERLLVDPAAVGGSGGAGTNSLRTWRPSPDGRLVLHGVTTGGSEAIVLRVRDVQTGRDLDAPIERNRWDVSAWLPDGRSFLYLQLRDAPPGAPAAGLFRDIPLRRHRVGEDAAADPVLFSPGMVGLDTMLLPAVQVDARNGLVFAWLRSGVESHSAFFAAPLDDVARGTPRWRPLFALADSVISVAAHGTDLYVLTRRGAPLGRVVRTPLARPDLATAETVLAEGAGSLLRIDAALDGVYVRALAEGVIGVHRIPWGGRPARVALPAGTSIGRLQADLLREGVLLTLDSDNAASLSYRYDPARGALEELPLRPAGPYDRRAGYVAETVFVPGHDGVRVPLSITRPERMARDGSLRILLSGYAGYGRADPPQFLPELAPWYEANGASAVCHARGGGYYGAAWHRAGQKATKPNSWLDFIACAEYLVREGYTRPERLVATGASAGGITIGRAITERPDLFAGAIISVGLLDAVRFETTPNGPPNVRELGSVATEEGFRALLAMSPVHHVRPGTAYPAVLLTAGLNDPRVVAWQPGKMAAALQAATTSGRPVLLRIDEAEGHGASSSDEQFRAYLADFVAFALFATGAHADPDAP